MLATTAVEASPAGRYPISIGAGTLAADNYGFTFAPGTLDLALWTFADWQARNFAGPDLADVARSGPSADPDADGLANLLEYAFDRDPMTADAAVLTNSVSGERLTLGYPLRRDVADLRYVPEVSADLTDWQSGAIAVEPLTTDMVDTWQDWVTVSDQTPLAPIDSRRFMRLRVEISAP